MLSGEGTFTVAGTGTLVLTRDSDFTLPRSRQRQRLVTYNGNHPLTRVDNPDPPAVIVERGATLQYGPGDGTAGSIGHYVPPCRSWSSSWSGTAAGGSHAVTPGERGCPGSQASH